MTLFFFNGTWEDHVSHVKKLLDVLQKEKLYVKMSKCEGQIVGGGQLKIDPSKIDVIVKWSKPTNVTTVHRFFGAVQYWRRFITNFSIISFPLHALMSVKQIFQWGGKQHKAFDTFREKISTTLVLALPDLRQPFEIEIDVNGYAMGEVLMQ